MSRKLRWTPSPELRRDCAQQRLETIRQRLEEGEAASPNGCERESCVTRSSEGWMWGKVASRVLAGCDHSALEAAERERTAGREQDGDSGSLSSEPEAERPLLAEVTCRTERGHHLLRPGKLNRIVYGCISRAQEAAPATGVCGFTFLSNHYHALFSVPDAPTLSHFMNLLQGTLGKEVCKVHQWSDHVWARRYTGLWVSDEPEDQLLRMLYLMRQGCKEGLVSSPLEWPGATSHHALLQGHQTIQGDWIDRTALYEHNRYAAKEDRKRERDVTNQNEIQLVPLPAFAHLERYEYQALLAELVRDVERETSIHHRERGTKPLGERKICAMHPHSRPECSKRSAAPSFHARGEVFKLLRAAYREFVKFYYACAERLRSGDRNVTFPIGCFPPPLPTGSEASPAWPRAPG